MLKVKQLVKKHVKTFGNCREQWIVSRLQKAEQAVHQAFATYRLDLAAQAIYDFIWNEYCCDWYVELTKPVLNDESVF